VEFTEEGDEIVLEVPTGQAVKNDKAWSGGETWSLRKRKRK